jgi:hypothetical protein
VGKAKARSRAKVEKETERKYSSLMETLRAGTGKETVEDVEDTFRQFYQNKGVQLPQKADYSARDIELLANAEAREIINSGYEDVVEEVERLAKLGAEKMTPREKELFKVLAEHRKAADRSNELAKLGIAKEVYNSKEFTEFAAQFNSTVPMEKVYSLFTKTQPKKEIQPIGSMKNGGTGEQEIKDFYTPEEARKFTKQDFDKNPALLAKIEECMRKW